MENFVFCVQWEIQNVMTLFVIAMGDKCGRSSHFSQQRKLFILFYEVILRGIEKIKLIENKYLFLF